MRDGDIDYSRYSLRELEEALAGINKHQYPKNHANLRAAYEQRAAPPAETPRPVIADTADEDAAPDAALKRMWDRFWDSRPVVGALGAFSFGWAYALFTRTDSCPSGRKVTGAIINALCERFGHAAAAGIPLLMGLVLVAYAVLPRRRDGD
ncbi:hypothetical protein [Agrilutibacter solisilvae]|uniref:Uncharacterized protein n=1 Tax=Agrilutibacter solisilvae TaxID=2763317 RepID=A0A974Y334_9GAMM|nr:hypothetical protein [Lysobacter solisilvae]QSX79575.1 hypothetical protein I8J32_006915 [Lysobacter solisilvae]